MAKVAFCILFLTETMLLCGLILYKMLAQNMNAQKINHKKEMSN